MFWRPLFTESNLPNVLDDEFQNVVNDLGDKRGFLRRFRKMVFVFMLKLINLYIYNLWVFLREESSFTKQDHAKFCY